MRTHLRKIGNDHVGTGFLKTLIGLGSVFRFCGHCQAWLLCQLRTVVLVDDGVIVNQQNSDRCHRGHARQDYHHGV